MKKLFEQIKVKNLVMKNRLIRSATWEGIANPDGSITDEAYEIYSELAKGGIGAIITGFTSVALHDYYFDGMMRLCDDALIPQYRKLVDIIHSAHFFFLSRFISPAVNHRTDILCLLRRKLQKWSSLQA